MFYAPSGIFLESDNSMLIADRNNKKIKRLNLNTNEVTTVISSGLNMPTDVVVANGNIYIADETCIKVFDGTTLKVYAGQASTVGYVDGQAKTARFGYMGLFTYRKADSAFFITDITNNVIRRLTFQDPPAVDFVANKTAVNVAQTVALTSTCSNNTVSYSWAISPNTYTLQSNSKLTDKNIFVSFNSVGSYTITFAGANMSADKTQVVKTNYLLKWKLILTGLKKILHINQRTSGLI
jgi:PKD repeat protein